MLKKELLELIKELDENDEVDNAINQSELAKKFGSLDVFKSKIENDKDFRSFIDSIKDKHLNTGLETWKTNNLQELIDEKVKELYPEEDPKDSEMKKLKLEIENMKKETLRKELTNKALKVATEKNLPIELVDFFIAQDENTTIENLGKFENVFNANLNKLVQERIKGNSHTPPASQGGGSTLNPFTKEHFNLTEQGKILKENPEHAKQLMNQAEKNE